MSAQPPIRVAGPGDAAAIAGLITAFRDYYGEAEPTEGEVLSTVERLLADERTEFLLAGDPPVAVAQLRFRLSVWTGVDDAWLEDLFVGADARRSGIGRTLAAACVERARARGCRRIQLDVNERNEGALAIYRTLGFESGSPRRWDGARDLYLTRWL